MADRFAFAREIRNTTWWRLLRHALPVYVLSRLCVLAGAAVVATELRVDANLADEQGLPLADPHGTVGIGNAVRPMLDVLTSWDGLWYMDIVRHGYPRTVPPDVTYHVEEARAAFFPLFPILGRWFDVVVPGGDSLAVLVMNSILGLIAVVLIGVIAQRLYGEAIGRNTATLVALFPGSFVLSFAYSEALMIVLAAACLLMLLDHEWVAAGVFAALATATRPNGLALVVACAVAAYLAIREDRDWRSLIAVLLAPVGFIVFQVWLGEHTGERSVWFRVQREAWDEGASFGWTAVKHTAEALTAPLTSPTDTITAISVVATIVLLVLSWRGEAAVGAHGVLVGDRCPHAVARHRDRPAALPVHRVPAADRRRPLVRAPPRHRRHLWPVTMAACGAGLAVLTGLYGVFGAIP